MGLASFDHLRLNQVEEMKPENIMQRQTQEAKTIEEKPIEKVKEVAEEETPRRRNTRRHN